MSSPIRVIQYGLGPIGQACVRQLCSGSREKVELVGAIDIDPEKLGRDVGQVCGLEQTLRVVVSETLDDALQKSNADIVLHTTASYLNVVENQISDCIRAGLSVVSSTEELSYPFDAAPDVSSRLDSLARAHEVTVVGTGVNPGFVMDTLALVTTAACARVNGVQIERVVDAGRRRLPLQKKIGAGISVEEFEQRKAAGGFGHVGLRESAQMVAKGLGWKIERLTEELDPEMGVLPALTNGQPSQEHVVGIRQQVSVTTEDGRRIDLLLRMYVGAENPVDRIVIDGDPPVTLEIPGGIFGDTATVAMLLNTMPRALEAKPGLLTMLDLAVPRAFDFAPSESATTYRS